MALDRFYLGPKASATDIECDNIDNERDTESFARIHRSQAQWTTPSSSPAGGYSTPFSISWSPAKAHHPSQLRMSQDTSVPTRQSPSLNATAMHSPRSWLSDLMFGARSIEPTPLASSQALLPGLNDGFSTTALFQPSMPTVLRDSNMPVLLESPAVAVATGMLGTESNASARYVEAHSPFPSGQAWSAGAGSEPSNAVAPYALGPLHTAPWEPKSAAEDFPLRTECTNSPLIYPQEYQSSSPLSVAVGHDSLDTPAASSSHESRVAKRRISGSSSSGQGYQMRELPRKRRRNADDVFSQSKRIFRYTDRPTPSPEDAQTAAINRLLGPCGHHQKGHKKCTCWAGYVKCTLLARLEVVPDLRDIRLFRKKPGAGHPMATCRAEGRTLQDIQGTVDAPREVHLSQDSYFKDSKGFEHKLVIQVVRFMPQEWDKTSRIWYKGGQKQILEMPPYCIASVEDARGEVQRYINASLPQYLDCVIQSSTQQVTKAMLHYARTFSKNGQSKMVQIALNMLAVCRMIEFSWRIKNPDAIGMTAIDDPASLWNGIVPLTPIMGTILDQIIIRYYLEPASKALLHELKEKFYQRAPHNVSEIILTSFILSTNVQLLLKHSRANAERYCATNRYNSLDLAKDYIKGYNILMAYIHIMLYDSSVSSQPKRPSQLTGLVVPRCSSWSKDEAAFFTRIECLLNSLGPELHEMRTKHMYEADLHWSHSIFLPQWAPHSPSPGSLKALKSPAGPPRPTRRATRPRGSVSS